MAPISEDAAEVEPLESERISARPLPEPRRFRRPPTGASGSPSDRSATSDELVVDERETLVLLVDLFLVADEAEVDLVACEWAPLLPAPVVGAPAESLT